jgi:flagellar motor switch protein FliN/FliY
MADSGDQLNQDELDNLLNQLDMADHGGGGQSQEDLDHLLEEEMLKMLGEESKSKKTSTSQAASRTSQIASRSQPASSPPVRPSDKEQEVHLVQFPEFPERQEPAVPQAGIERLLDITLLVSAELGRKSMPIREILDLGEGSLVDLDTPIGVPIELLVNNKKFAKGEIMAVGDKYAIRITELVSPVDRLKNL